MFAGKGGMPRGEEILLAGEGRGEGFCREAEARGCRLFRCREAGEPRGLAEALAASTPDRVVFLPGEEELPLRELLAVCRAWGVRAGVLFPGEALPQELQPLPLDLPRNRAAKRACDILLSGAALAALAPALLLTAALVRATSPGPALYRQERVGRSRRPFLMYKFRSMRQDVSGGDRTAWSRRTDSRRTPVGAVLRKLSLDELPQLWNVLRGEMSLVGPRPEIPYYVEKFSGEVPRYLEKHRVRPGITGLAQVLGWRGDTSIPERVRWDLWYIENWSLRLDLFILWRTLFSMVNPQESLGARKEGAGWSGQPM